jgi:type IV pilus assembly protein PilW
MMKLLVENTNALISPLDSRGFTLVELLIALTISLLLLSGVYTSFLSQQGVYSAQQEVAKMQQSLRSAIFLLQREIRMAGYDPTGNANTGFLVADANTIQFTADLRGDAEGSDPDSDTADPDETITFSLFDCDGDGDMDLRRTDPTVVPADAGKPIEHLAAENIKAINFLYFDKDGNQTAVLADIRTVQITMVSQASKPDYQYTDNSSYTNKQGTLIFTSTGSDSNYRHRRVYTMVKCKNMGL